MPQQLDNLVFDRTALDVQRLHDVTARLVSGTATAEDRAAWLAGMKGAYNYTDLNRVGAAVEYLTRLLASLGYDPAAEVRLVWAGNEPDKAWCDASLPYFSGTVSLPVSLWTETDIPNSGQMAQYLNNVKTLRACLPYVAPNAPADMVRLTWQEANAIEEILATLGDVLEAMQAAFLTRQANTLFMIAGGVFNNA